MQPLLDSKRLLVALVLLISISAVSAEFYKYAEQDFAVWEFSPTGTSSWNNTYIYACSDSPSANTFMISSFNITNPNTLPANENISMNLTVSLWTNIFASASYNITFSLCDNYLQENKYSWSNYSSAIGSCTQFYTVNSTRFIPNNTAFNLSLMTLAPLINGDADKKFSILVKMIPFNSTTQRCINFYTRDRIPTFDGAESNALRISWAIDNPTYLDVTVSSPPDDDVSAVQKNVTFTALSSQNSTFPCNIYIDSSLYSTLPSVSNNTATTFGTVWGIGSHTYYVSCNDSVNVGNSDIQTFTFNSSHSVVIWNPPNETRTNMNENVAFEVYDSDNATTSCSLYIDSVLNESNGAVVNDTITYFNPAWSQGVHSWYISCNDGLTSVNSSTYLFDLDSTAPYITSVTPNSFNSTIFNAYSMNIKGNVTDDNLWRVNVTIWNPNSTEFYNDYSGDLATTSYSWDETFNTTLMPNGVYTMLIEGADSHTAQYFDDAKTVVADIADTKLVYELDYDTVQVARVGGVGKVTDVSTQKLDDRYTFDFKYQDSFREGDTETFRVTSEQPIIYLPDSGYKAHFILANKYWLDFENYNGDVSVTKINDFNYDVQVTITTATEVIAEPVMEELGKEGKGGAEPMITETSNPLTDLKFMSLGGLNEASLSLTFEIDNCIPSWMCSGYDACNESDESACNSATDLNTCGLTYTGDLSEFTAQSCNFCARNIEIVNASDCVDKLSLHCYEDTNWATCCDVTKLPSDCFADTYQTESIVCVNETCSTFAYSENDISGAVIDTIAKFFITIAILIGTITIIILGIWVWNSMDMRKK